VVNLAIVAEPSISWRGKAEVAMKTCVRVQRHYRRTVPKEERDRDDRWQWSRRLLGQLKQMAGSAQHEFDFGSPQRFRSEDSGVPENRVPAIASRKKETARAWLGARRFE